MDVWHLYFVTFWKVSMVKGGGARDDCGESDVFLRGATFVEKFC